MCCSTYFKASPHLNPIISYHQAGVLHNISVTMVCPGPVVSEIVDHAMSSKLDQKHDSRYVLPSLQFPRMRSQMPIHASTEGEKKMPTDRCAHLMAVGVANRMPELWISGQPVLLLTYINQFFPRLTRFAYTKLIGPARVRVFRQGGDVYDFKQLLG